MTTKKKKTTKERNAVSADADTMNPEAKESISKVEADAKPVNFDVRGVSKDWMEKIRTKVREAAMAAKPMISCAKLALEMYQKHIASSEKVKQNVLKAYEALKKLDEFLDHLTIPGITDQMSRREIEACVRVCLEEDKELQDGINFLKNELKEDAQK